VHLIDYVNFQFYAYDKRTIALWFIDNFHRQGSNYNGKKVLVSFISVGMGGLSPIDGFFKALQGLRVSSNFIVSLFGLLMIPCQWFSLSEAITSVFEDTLLA
jgi:hypothetical protein